METSLPAATGLRLCPDTSGHPGLDGAPVTWVTTSLWDALQGLASRLSARDAANPDQGAVAALRLILAAAYDTAEPSEQPGQLYATPPVVELGRRCVWAVRESADGPITARFPDDPW